jgi:hypothetical protein
MSRTRSPRPRGARPPWPWGPALAGLLVAVLVPGCAAGNGGQVGEAPPEPPPAEVVALVEGTLSEEGRRLLYRARPRVLDKAAFDAACPNHGELTLVLGCYDHGTVAILRVERPELARIMEVTAAHEMLHVAYVTLSAGERAEVDSWIEQFYATVDDPDMRDLVSEYEREGPERRLNELHSILPTEVAVLSPELEDYYTRYFVDRARVVEAHASYEAVFRDLKQRVADLHRELDGLKAQLDALESRMSRERAELEALNGRLDQLRGQGNFRAYNSLIPQQNALAGYNALVDRFNQLVDVHNEKADQVNELALEQDQLATSLGSKPSLPAA